MAMGKYDLNDFRKQIVQMRSMGSVREFMGSIPGLGGLPHNPGGEDVEREIKCIQGMIDSMTPLERSYPFLITVPGRCLRIAAGTGVESSEVKGLFTQFKAMSELLRNLQASRRRNG